MCFNLYRIFPVLSFKLIFRVSLVVEFALFFCSGGFAQGKKTVVLTFDDAVQSHYSYVAPLLKKYGFGATFYVCEFDGFSDTSKYMNWRQIAALDRMGFDIGNHTRHHTHVEGLSEAQMRSELGYINDKCASLGISRPVSFAYPGYTTGGFAVQVLKELGYNSARTGGEVPYLAGLDDPFLISSFTPGDDLGKAIAAVSKAKDGEVVVLTIHGVPDNAHSWVSTSPAVFEGYLKYLHDHGYAVISMREMMERVRLGKIARAAPPVFYGSGWISPGYNEGAGKRAVPVFRKGFSVSGKVKSAVLSVTALGVYGASLNGKRVGSDYLAPGFTNYNKRLQYQQYDVTGLLKSGKGVNDLQVTVAEGWYRGVFRGAKVRDNYGASAGLLLELAVVYKDGRSEKVVSDGSWSCGLGPIQYSELYDGELFDAGFVTSDWSAVKLLDYPKNILVPSETPPVREQESFKPVRIFKTPLGEQVVDFGQNLAGFVRLKVRGKAGDTVRVFHAEVLDKTGNFYTGNLREAKAVDTYVLSGNGLEVFAPHFTYHGFRYVKVEGAVVRPGDLTAVALYSDLKKTGTFACSDTLINRLQKNIEWSMNSNFVDIPTDCPQRSERLGWLGDAQVFAGTAGFIRDTRSFYAKWLKDLASEQGTNGGLPTYVPTVAPFVAEQYGVAGWGDAATIVPWTVYSVYGDTAVLRNQYQSMVNWVNYVASQSPDGLWKAKGYGDWYAPGEATALPYVDQCFYYHSVDLLCRTAKVLGDTAAVKACEGLMVQVRDAFMDTYVKQTVAGTKTQTAYVLALAFELLPEALRAETAAKLVALIHANNDHLATGFLGTPYLLKVLSDYGYSNLAYTLLNQKTYPSWLLPVKMGATTIWEKWDGMSAEGQVQPTSYNHYAYGAVGSWLYEYVAGIRAGSPGYKKIVIRPEIGGGLTWASASYECSFGKIVSEWKVSGAEVHMSVLIPSGTTASVYVPGKAMVTVGPGKHSFVGTIGGQGIINKNNNK